MIWLPGIPPNSSRIRISSNKIVRLPSINLHCFRIVCFVGFRVLSGFEEIRLLIDSCQNIWEFDGFITEVVWFFCQEIASVYEDIGTCAGYNSRSSDFLFELWKIEVKLKNKDPERRAEDGLFQPRRGQNKKRGDNPNRLKIRCGRITAIVALKFGYAEWGRSKEKIDKFIAGSRQAEAGDADLHWGVEKG